MYYFVQITLLFLVINNSVAKHLNDQDIRSIYDPIKSYATESVQAKAANDVILRTLPYHAHFFEIEVNFQLPPHTFRIYKDDITQAVQIEASSGVIACKAFYYYIKYYLNGHISWEGARIQIPDHLPSVNVTQTSPSRFIYYQNVCTWSYSFAWWKWSDWRRHIDWIAMQGITLTIAVVQEQIWERVYTELGLTKDEIDDHFAGPGFFAWQRMGNIRGWGGPLTTNFKFGSSLLQKKMIGALRELGVAVALPAFAGHVPIAFKRIFPNATLSRVQRWNKFPDQFCCPLFIDPTDELFQRVGTIFLKYIIAEYGGTNHIYFSDPFNEIQPRLAEEKYLADAATGIYETMKAVDDKAVWLLQGWMFVKNPFWSENLLKAFLTAVPLGRLLVLDLQSELYPQYIRTSSFYGQPFIWCMLHNFGGTLGMHGSINIVNEDIAQARKMNNSTMLGAGITPEGINQNYVMYEFALERAWDQTSVNISKWINQYTFGRYGLQNDKITSAWEKLVKTVYSYNGIIKISGKYTVCHRPSLELLPWTWYNLTEIDDVLHDLLRIPADQSNELLKHDIVDVTRQMLQNKIDQLYPKIVADYNAANLTALKEHIFIFQDILLDLDRILLTSRDFLLGRWLESSKAIAENSLEAANYEFNARNQITTWGPKGQIVDYAMKQWAGMVADYCLPRWKLFFDELKYSVLSGKKIDNNKCQEKIFKQVEEPFTVSNKEYAVEGNGDTFLIANDIYNKWRYASH